MSQEIINKLKELHFEYTTLKEMQLDLPFRRSRTANHDETEQAISNAAHVLSRKILDFKKFCYDYHPHDDSVAKLLSKHNEIEHMSFVVNKLIYDQYQRF